MRDYVKLSFAPAWKFDQDELLKVAWRYFPLDL